MAIQHHQNPPAPITLSFDAIDELIYDARVGDLNALKAEIEKLSSEHNVSASSIVRSAIDTEDESEGGTGACLLHWPAANGNIELLNFLLQALQDIQKEELSAFVNYRNHSGNTPLHWAALNTHLDCVKALVEAGADIGAKNDAGHDALFLAERVDWSSEDHEEGEGEAEAEAEAEAEVKVGEEKKEDKESAPMSKARQVVEWLLGCDKGAGFERPVGNGNANGSGDSPGGNQNHEEMEGVEETTS